MVPTRLIRSRKTAIATPAPNGIEASRIRATFGTAPASTEAGQIAADAAGAQRPVVDRSV